jgi:acetyl esterase
VSYDPQVKALLAEIAADGRPSHRELPLPEGRRNFVEKYAPLSAAAPVLRADDIAIDGTKGVLRLRAYRPEGRPPRTALLFLHGGGFVFGDLDSHDGLCRLLANVAGTVVVSVDYRRAPEHPYPAALDDAYTACLWLAAQSPALGIDRRRLAVGGDSAGGNLAAAVALLARDLGGPRLAGQLLLYPALDPGLDSPSAREFASDPFLDRAEIDWYWQRYLGLTSPGDAPYANPLLAADLSRLPPAHIVIAENDPLRDGGKEYGRRLEEAGIPVQVALYPGMPHGFLSMTGRLDVARAAVAEIGQALCAQLNRAALTTKD